jgi:hypothetical protein
LWSGEDVKAFEEIWNSKGVIREVFSIYVISAANAMREIFGEIWPLAVEEARELYNAFPPDSARADEQSFKAQGRGKIEEYSRTLVSQDGCAMREHWRGIADEWAAERAASRMCLAVDCKGIVDAITI